jgi:hypothetical protein
VRRDAGKVEQGLDVVDCRGRDPECDRKARAPVGHVGRNITHLSRIAAMAPIDHLMWVVPDLGAGIDELEHRTGERAKPGGAHTGLGTANALLGLGRGTYLEVLGPDPALAEPTALGATLAAEPAARLAGWAVRCDDIDSVCAALMGAGWPVAPTAMSRTRPDGVALSWHVAVMPGRPLGDHWPFVIDWGSSPHPSDDLHGECTLEALAVSDPEPAELLRLLDLLGVEGVDVSEGPAGVRATLRTRSSNVEL